MQTITDRVNKTGYTGVKFIKRSSVYEAWIRDPISKKKIYCGRGATAEGAYEKYKAKCKELFGSEARLK